MECSNPTPFFVSGCNALPQGRLAGLPHTPNGGRPTPCTQFFTIPLISRSLSVPETHAVCIAFLSAVIRLLMQCALEV